MRKRISLSPQNLNIWDDLDKFLIKKYGTKHTVKTLFIEKSVQKHLIELGVPGHDNNKSDIIDTHTHKPISLKKRKLLKSFLERFKGVDHVKNENLKTFIRETMVLTDPRPVNNYIRVLKDQNWIKKKPRRSEWDIRIPDWDLEQWKNK